MDRPETVDAATEPGLTDAEAITYCYGHPGTPTKLRCSRCDRPICGRCAIPASVGQHCPECVAEARRTAPKVRSVLRATAPVVYGIIAINVAVYVLQTIVPATTFALDGFPPPIAGGEWFRLLTAMFLHAPLFQGGLSLMHIFFNMYALSIFGPHLEQGFGAVRFLALYLISGFLGSAASYSFGPCARSVGASGAIFGVLGGLLVFLYNRRQRQFVRDYMRSVGSLVVLNLVIMFFVPFIDKFAHLGGLAAGAVLGFGFDRPSNAARVVTAIAVVAGGVLLVAWKTSSFGC